MPWGLPKTYWLARPVGLPRALLVRGKRKEGAKWLGQGIGLRDTRRGTEGAARAVDRRIRWMALWLKQLRRGEVGRVPAGRVPPARPGTNQMFSWHGQLPPGSVPEALPPTPAGANGSYLL